MNHFVIRISNDPGNATLRGCPIHTDGRSLEDAKQAMRWQEAGGFNLDRYVIAVPEADLPGVMTTVTGKRKPVLIHNEGWTDEAFALFILNTWKGN